MPLNPPSNAHGFAMRSMSLRDIQIPKSEKKISWPPPLPNPGDAPDSHYINVVVIGVKSVRKTVVIMVIGIEQYERVKWSVGWL